MENRAPSNSLPMSATTPGVREKTATGRQPTRVPSEALLGALGELIIVHAGREYRLRRTSLGKLLLTA